MDKPIKITVGTPHVNNFTCEYVQSLLGTYLMGPGYWFGWIASAAALVHLARNRIVAEAEGDYILFADSDITWTPEMVKSLVEANKPIIGGVFVLRIPPYYPVVFRFNKRKDGYENIYEIPDDGEPFKCDAIGTGFLLVKRSVFKALAEQGEKYPFDPILWPYANFDRHSKALPEDMSFCHRAQKAGFEVWAHAGVQPGHVGKVVVDYTKARETY